MPRRSVRQGVLLGALLVLSSVAPAPAEKPTARPNLLERRFKAASKFYDLAWLYYREKRINAPMLYGASLEVLRCETDLRPDPAGRAIALEAHAKRFHQLETLLAELKRKGVITSSFDLASVDYFKLQIEYLQELEKPR